MVQAMSFKASKYRQCGAHSNGWIKPQKNSDRLNRESAALKIHPWKQVQRPKFLCSMTSAVWNAEKMF